MFSASSNQSFVHDGAGYEEVYPSGHKDYDSPSEERSPSAFSSSSRDEDVEMGGLEENFGDDVEPPIQSVIGPDGLREFIMLPQWMVNVFNSTINESHFKTLRAKYQITSPSVYHKSRRRVITKEWRVLEYISRC